ncbi:MAG: hypothetical protein KBT11_03140 [Treponema sp.]|nr:hypothetical protein [Candidatus Treponema equifaecale]
MNCFVFSSCNNVENSDSVPIEEYYVKCPEFIRERAFEFARLYAESETEYFYGGQEPLRAIKIDCSGLVVMAYKYALAL